MEHYMLDSYNSFRSRLEDVTLIYEILQRIPYELHIKTVMPPMVLPYFDGFVPEDCGISAFVFFKGGHFTIHTFSFRECYFVDFTHPHPFEAAKLTALITRSLPTDQYKVNRTDRDTVSAPSDPAIDPDQDFGPHVFFKMKTDRTPSMDTLFELFDELPQKIDMTPIMRPYAIKNKTDAGLIYSAMTMIAESHISMHWHESSSTAYFDLFSCKFFDENDVMPKLFDALGVAKETPYTLISRGSRHKSYAKSVKSKLNASRQWVGP